MQKTAKMSKPTNLPPFLYRGDGDPDGIRLLKAKIGHFQFHTNLINNGVGRMVFEKPIEELISKHVSTVWNTSHFLSFTTQKLTAIRFGIKRLNEPEDRIAENLDAYYEDDNDFDCALLELDTARVGWQEVRAGLYEGQYPATLLEVKRFSDQFHIVLMDVATVLKHSSNYADYRVAIANAERDSEWLVLPTNHLPGLDGYSAKIDGNCFSAVTRYRYRPL